MWKPRRFSGSGTSPLRDATEHAAVQEELQRPERFDSENERAYARAFATTLYLASPYALQAAPQPSAFGLHTEADVQRVQTAVLDAVCTVAPRFGTGTPPVEHLPTCMQVADYYGLENDCTCGYWERLQAQKGMSHE